MSFSFMLRSLLRTRAQTAPPISQSRALSSSPHTKLAFEWIVDGKVLPAAELNGAHRDRDVIVFLHGLLGNAKNLRTPAKKLTKRLPNLAALSIDIRGHGNSSPHPAPHTFNACTQDIYDTIKPLGLVDQRSPIAICGHSLGGRIALQFAHDLSQNNSLGIRPPRQTWILDSVPGQPDPSVHNVLKAISSIPLPVASKSDVTSTLIEKHNFNKSIAMWIASNLKPTNGGFEWIFDLNTANGLLSHFTNQNFHEMIETIANKEEVHLVMAGKNKEWTQQIVDGLESIPRDPVERFQMYKLEKAGHWVHVDDLEGLLELLVGALKRYRS